MSNIQVLQASVYTCVFMSFIPPYSSFLQQFARLQRFKRRCAIEITPGDDWTISECIDPWRESDHLETMKERFDGYFAQRSLTVDEASYSINRSLCVWDISNGVLTVFYLGLFICCLLLLLENSQSWSSGQSSGLLWYLGCTSVLCACRFVGFVLVLSIGKGEGVREMRLYAVRYVWLFCNQSPILIQRLCSVISDDVTLIVVERCCSRCYH